MAASIPIGPLEATTGAAAAAAGASSPSTSDMSSSLMSLEKHDQQKLKTQNLLSKILDKTALVQHYRKQGLHC
jgi:hypothetical protein